MKRCQLFPASLNRASFAEAGLAGPQPRWVFNPRERRAYVPDPRGAGPRCITVCLERRPPRGLVMRGEKSACDETTHTCGSDTRQGAETTTGIVALPRAGRARTA